MRLVFLGTGTSFGVPVIGCSCRACVSKDPRDARWRASVLIEDRGTSVVVDAGPEFRLQALRARMTRLDALLLSHAHADHVNGLDDLRPFTRNRVLPVYGNAPTLAETAERFAYVFRETQLGGGKPLVDLVEAKGPIAIGALTAVPVPILHGSLPILGWRIGALAYLTDCSGLPESSLALLAGTEVLVMNALRHAPHPTHFSIRQALEAARLVAPRETWLIHMNHEATHAELEEYCAREGRDVGARPAWDGLELEL